MVLRLRNSDLEYGGGEYPPPATATMAKPELALISGISKHPSSLNTTFQQTHLGADPGKPEGSGQEEQPGEEKQSKHD